MYTAQSYHHHHRQNPYIVNQINDATPQQLIMKVYDFAILNCQKNNMLKTNDALQVLINALNFSDPEAQDVSIGLLRLYQYCQNQMRKHNNKIVLNILTELRDAWHNALKNMR